MKLLIFSYFSNICVYIAPMECPLEIFFKENVTILEKNHLGNFFFFEFHFNHEVEKSNIVIIHSCDWYCTSHVSMCWCACWSLQRSGNTFPSTFYPSLQHLMLGWRHSLGLLPFSWTSTISYCQGQDAFLSCTANCRFFYFHHRQTDLFEQIYSPWNEMPFTKHFF